MDYVKIPQNIRVEDKLIGPLSLRQIIIIALGGGVSYTLYAMVSKSFGGIPPLAHVFIWLPVALCAAFALVKINDIPLTRYSLLTFELMVKPRRRLWQPRRGLNVLPHAMAKKMKEDEKTKKDSAMVQPEKKSTVRLAELSTLLDRGGVATVQKAEGSPEIVSDADVLLDASDTEAAAHGQRLDAMWKEMKKSSPVSS